MAINNVKQQALDGVDRKEPKRKKKERQTLRRALALAVQHVLLGLAEVLAIDTHTSLAQRHEPSFGADCLRVSHRRARDEGEHIQASKQVGKNGDKGAGDSENEGKRVQPYWGSHALISAPERSSLAMTNSSSLTSAARVMRDVWIVKMRRLVFSSGSGNSILRSMRPGRMRAGSSDSMRFVAMITCHQG
jgi:hypothetical protein